jgi:CheY-like chemotaxis protein
MAKSVLIVEDDDGIREAMSTVLLDEGFDPICAENGARALEMLADIEPQIIVLDLWMPHMDGWEFASRLRDDPKRANIPIILLSADTTVSEVGKTMGVKAALKKPVDLEQLLHVVARAV